MNYDTQQVVKLEKPLSALVSPITINKMSMEASRNVESGNNRKVTRVYIKPVEDKISTRPKVLPGSITRLYLLMDKDKRYIINHTKEELEKEYQSLYINQEFLETFCSVIPSNGKVLDLSQERDLFEYRVLATFPEVVAMSADQQSHTTLFYVYSEMYQALAANKKADKIFEAQTKLRALTASEKIDILSLYGFPTKNATEETCKFKLTEQINLDPDKFLQFVESSSSFEDKALILKCVEYHILRRDLNSFYFNQQLLGASLEEAIEYLGAPNRENFKNQLKTALSAKLISK